MRPKAVIQPVVTSADTGQESTDQARILDIAAPMSADQVRLLDLADLQLAREQEQDGPDQAQPGRREQDGPACAAIIPVKIGFRANANRPPVTSSVFSLGSTPIRQDRPMPCCARAANTNPAAVSTRPTQESATPQTPSGRTMSVTPTAASAGAASPASRATPNSSPAALAQLPRLRLNPLNPVDPVARLCCQLRTPNNTTAPPA